MGVDLYQLGVSGLMTAQRQLSTTSHNINNADTVGYTRQRADQIVTEPLFEGGSYYGTGVQISDVKRIYNEFAYEEQLTAQTRYSYTGDLNSRLDGLDTSMSQGSSIVLGAMDQLYTAVNAVTDQPSDNGMRRMLLNQAGTTSTEIKSFQANLESQIGMLNSEIENAATEVTLLSKRIATLNQEIMASMNTGGQPNDLLDQRDQLVMELAEYTDVSTLQNPNNTISVFIGNGQMLVAETLPLSMKAVPSQFDPSKKELVLNNNNHDIALEEQVLGGKIQSIFEYRDNHLQGAINEVGLVILALSDTFNQQQSEGLDLNAMQGKNIFKDINDAVVSKARVLQDKKNTGNLASQVNITDVSKLTSDSYKLAYDGANYTLTNETTGDSSVLTEDLPVGSGLYSTNEGFQLQLNSGIPAAGDKFQIVPTRGASNNFAVVMSDTDHIAASSAVEVYADSNNVNTGKIEIAQVYDPVAAKTLVAAGDLTVEVLENPPGTTTYTVTDHTGTTIASGPYTTSPMSVDVPPAPATALFSIKLEGQLTGVAPNGPEKFTISDVYGAGNSQNMLAVAETQARSVIRGNMTLSEAMGSAASVVGSNASAAESSYEVADSLLEQSTARAQEISGVNLDEEASNLIRYQQAYQASSRIISTAQTLFDTLMQAV